MPGACALRGSSRGLFAAWAALAWGCATPVPVAPAEAAPAAADPSDDARSFIRFHSRRFHLSVPLPDGQRWVIDDRSGRAFVARHPPTGSTLTAITLPEPDLMNRQRCQDRVEAAGLLALRDPRTVDDEVTVGPDGYDSRVWITLEPAPSANGPLTGHATLVGASIRRCLFVDYATQVASAAEEPRLTARLATARVRILANLRIEAFDEPARERPPER